MSKGALVGTRVLELSGGLAGPSAGRILAGLGADVVKIEMVGTGDFTREVVPWVFRSHNRDKRSVALDLKAPAGREIVRRLAGDSDVFLQSQRPGLLSSIGLDQAALSAINPRLIYASLSGFGSEGPDAHRRAVDMLIQAESGMGAAQSGLLGNLSFVDSAAGLSLANGILAALLQRALTGEVQHVHASLLDTALYLQAAPLAEFSATGVSIDQTTYWDRYATVGLFDTADGPIYLAAYWNRDWEAICTLLGRPELAVDARFASAAARSEHSEDVRSILNSGFAGRSRSSLVDELEGLGIMAGAARTYAEALKWPQIEVNQPFVADVDGAGNTTLFAKPAFRLSPDDRPASLPAPEVGASTVAILQELGITDSELKDLLDTGVISGQDMPPGK